MKAQQATMLLASLVVTKEFNNHLRNKNNF